MKGASKRLGLPPGTLVYTGEQKVDKVGFEIIDYSGSKIEEKKTEKVEDCFSYRKKKTVTWINIVGLHNTEVISKLGEKYDLHPLVMEGILNTQQRPKFEESEKHIFLVLKMLRYDEKKKKIDVEQVSLILGDNFVLSFQEMGGDVFDPLRKRIRASKGRIRTSGPDYLTYAIVDSLVDNYFVILEKLGDEIEHLDAEVTSNPSQKTMNKIHNLKRELIRIRKSVWPMREVVNFLQRAETKLIKKSTGIFLRDVYDHTVQVVDSIETYRDMVSGLLDIYLSSISNKMNDVMKVLTIFASIFIPLTFIAGIYGMNFEYMPELGWKYSYFVVWGVIILVTAGMFRFYKRRGWI